MGDWEDELKQIPQAARPGPAQPRTTEVVASAVAVAASPRLCLLVFLLGSDTHTLAIAMSIQGLILEVRVTGCRKLRDTEFFSRQDPYVCLEYANTKLRTRTCTDGGRNPSFDDKFHIPLIEGLRELNVIVWNSNTVNNDDFIGSGRVQLQKVLTRGYDDSSWPLQTRHMRSAGEVKVIMHFDVSTLNNKMGGTFPPKSAMPYTASSPSYPPMPYAASSLSYPPKSAPAPALASAMPYAAPSPSYPPPAGYPDASSHKAYPTHSNAPYPAPAYPSPPPHQPCPHEAYPSTAYPPQPHGQPYPPHPHEQPYPPHPHGPHEQPYPPHPHGQSYPPQPYGQPSPAAQSPYPPAPYPGTYPPPPY